MSGFFNKLSTAVSSATKDVTTAAKTATTYTPISTTPQPNMARIYHSCVPGLLSQNSNHSSNYIDLPIGTYNMPATGVLPGSHVTVTLQDETGKVLPTGPCLPNMPNKNLTIMIGSIEGFGYSDSTFGLFDLFLILVLFLVVFLIYRR